MKSEIEKAIELIRARVANPSTRLIAGAADELRSIASALQAIERHQDAAAAAILRIHAHLKPTRAQLIELGECGLESRQVLRIADYFGSSG